MAKQTTGCLFKRGETYWLKYSVNGKVFRESLGVTTKPKAIEERAKRMAPLAARDATERVKQIAAAVADASTTAAAVADANRDKLAVANAFEAFTHAANRPQCGDLTLLDYDQRWAKFSGWWKTHAPSRPTMEQVTPADAEAFVTHLNEGTLSANRWNKIIQTCRFVFNTLARQCGNMANPFGATAAAGIANRRQVVKGRRELSEGELRSVCGGAQGELRTLLAVGIFTGLRLHDAACLRWESVSLERGRITVQPAKTLSRSGKTVVIPLHPALAGILAETQPESRRDFVMPQTAELYTRSITALSHQIQRMFAAAKIVTTKDNGTTRGQCLVGFHSLRHSFVSMSARAGTPLAVIQELCGHGSPAIQRAYLHMGETATRAAVGVLPDVMVPAAPAAQPDPATILLPTDTETILAKACALLAEIYPGITPNELAAFLCNRRGADNDSGSQK